MTHSLTIVSALYQVDTKYEIKRRNYLRRGRYILAIDCPKVIYVDKENYHILYAERKSGWQKEDRKHLYFYYDEQTIIIHIPYTETYYASFLQNEELKYHEQRKNTREYLTMVNNKFFFVNYTIDAQFWPYQYMMWMDIGVTYVCYSLPEIKIKLPPPGKLKCPLVKYPEEYERAYNNLFKSIISAGLLLGDLTAWTQIIEYNAKLFAQGLKLGGTHEQTNLEHLCFGVPNQVIAQRDFFDLYPADYFHLLLNLSEIKANSTLIKRSLQIARKQQHWSEVIALGTQVYPPLVHSPYIDKTDLAEIANELYMAYYYTNQKEKLANVVQYFRQEGLLDYSHNSEYLKTNFAHVKHWVINGISLDSITPVQPHVWRTRFVSFYIGDEIPLTTQLGNLDNDIPLTIYVEQHNEEKIRAHFQNAPHVKIGIITEHDKRAFRLVDTITKNREITKYITTHNNNPVYFCRTVTKFFLIRSHLEELFDKQKVVWLDFDLHEKITRIKLLDIDNCHPKKFEACLIHYRSLSFVNHQFDGYCSIAANVLAGDYNSWLQVSDSVEQLFYETVQHQCGHTEEQLLSRLYHFHPEWFKLWYGDYDCLLTNYKFIKEKVDSIKKFVFWSAHSCTSYNSHLVAWNCGVHIVQSKLADYLGSYQHQEIISPLYQIGKLLQISNLLPPNDYIWLQRLYLLQSDDNEQLYIPLIPIILQT